MVCKERLSSTYTTTTTTEKLDMVTISQSFPAEMPPTLGSEVVALSEVGSLSGTAVVMGNTLKVTGKLQEGLS